MAESKKVTRVFQMTLDTAMHFFVLVKWTTDHGVEDSASLRQYILNWLAKNKHMDRVYDTKRSEAEVIKDYKRQGLIVDDRREE